MPIRASETPETQHCLAGAGPTPRVGLRVVAPAHNHRRGAFPDVRRRPRPCPAPAPSSASRWPGAVDSYLAVHADGSVTIVVGKVDIGTGGRIAIRQLVAEELDLPLERIAMIEGDTALTPNQGATAGSYGIVRGGVQLPAPGAWWRAPGVLAQAWWATSRSPTEWSSRRIALGMS